MPPGFAGTWVSEVRPTDWGPMHFEFHIGGDGRFDVTGTPLPSPEGEVYRHGGPYRLEGGRLVTPALNDGQPVDVRLRQGRLLLRIDDRLEFRLQPR